MSDRSDIGGSIAAVIAAVLIGLLIVGGGVFFFARQTMISRQAFAAEARAREMAEQARAQEMLAQKSAATASSRIPISIPSSAADRDQIVAVLNEQARLWNAGDLDGFMDHYWKSDDLTFSAGGKTTRGWQATLERYRTRYPGVKEMGQLAFENLEVFPLAESAALVLGEWKLNRENDPVGGNFSLVVRKFDDRWLVIHDHTSSLREEVAP